MLPLLLDADEAIDHWHDNPNATDAVKSYIVAFLAGEGYSNTQIRSALSIPKVYTVTHYKRCGSITEEELELWDKNPDRIKLGHIRAIASKLKSHERLEKMRDLLVSMKATTDLHNEVQGRTVNSGAELRQFAERVGEQTGRPTTISFNKAKQNGSITFKYQSLDDLADIVKALGYKEDEF